jgi:hypothetical protein
MSLEKNVAEAQALVMRYMAQASISNKWAHSSRLRAYRSSSNPTIA